MEYNPVKLIAMPLNKIFAHTTMPTHLTLFTVLLIAPRAKLIAEPPRDTAWRVLDGPEKEKGDALRSSEELDRISKF